MKRMGTKETLMQCRMVIMVGLPTGAPCGVPRSRQTEENGMKRNGFALLVALVCLAVGNAHAVKTRGIASDGASATHLAHLAQHLYATDLHGTGNYLKVRMDAKDSYVLGHLEQADQFVLLALQNGYAKVVVTQSADTSPDSWVGLAGWVDADYIDCPCNDAQYAGAASVTQPAAPEGTPIPKAAVGEYIFASGAGAWSTSLVLLPDGAFVGVFGDSDMGDTGADYPNGIHYFCMFRGQFGGLQPVGDHAYAMTLAALLPEPAQDHIADGVLYIASEAYGIAGGSTFLLYTPEALLSEVSKDFLLWMHHPEPAPGETLGCYALFNQQTGDTFFSEY